MERLILDYTATGQHTLVLNNAAEYQSFTKDNIRLIIDCTTQEVIVSPLDRTALSAVAYNGTTKKLTITLTASSAPLTVNGEVTLKVDTGSSSTGDVAKQGSNPNVSLTSLDGKLGNVVMMTNDEKQPAKEDALSHIVWHDDNE